MKKIYTYKIEELNPRKGCLLDAAMRQQKSKSLFLYYAYQRSCFIFLKLGRDFTHDCIDLTYYDTHKTWPKGNIKHWTLLSCGVRYVKINITHTDIKQNIIWKI